MLPVHHNAGVLGVMEEASMTSCRNLQSGRREEIKEKTEFDEYRGKGEKTCNRG